MVSHLATGEPEKPDKQWVWQAAYRLGPESFTVLWLFYKQEMTTSEIAKVMKKTKVTIRVLLHRARKRLAKQIIAEVNNAEKSVCSRDQIVFIGRAK